VRKGKDVGRMGGKSEGWGITVGGWGGGGRIKGREEGGRENMGRGRDKQERKGSK